MTRKADSIKYFQYVQNWNPPPCWGERKLVQPEQKTAWQFLQIELLNDPTVLLQGICPPKLKTISQRYIHTSTFIAALVTIAQQPKCPQMDEQINKMWLIVLYCVMHKYWPTGRKMAYIISQIFQISWVYVSVNHLIQGKKKKNSLNWKLL